MGDWISKAEVLRMLDENGVVFRAELEKMPALNAVPVEWLQEKMQKPCTTDANPFGYVLDEWLEEQEAR